MVQLVTALPDYDFTVCHVSNMHTLNASCIAKMTSVNVTMDTSSLCLDRPEEL